MTEKPSYQELELYVRQLEQTVLKKSRAETINKTLFHIVSAMNTSDNLDAFYQSIHQHLATLMDVTNFYIALYFREENAIQWAYWKDETERPTPDRIENFTENRSLTGDVILARQPMLLDEKRLQDLAGQNRVRGKVPKIWLGVPLMLHGDVVGVMAVQSYTNAKLFSQSDVEVLSFISDQIAFSIERKQNETKLQQVQQRLIQSEKLEAIGTLAGGIAHDFNNTLSVTLGNINLAQMMSDDVLLSEHLADAEKSVLQAKELASRFIVFSKGGTSIKNPIDCHALLDQTLSSVGASHGITYKLSITDLVPVIEADQARLQEALKNIIINAAEAMEFEHPVQVSAGIDPDKKGMIRICVKDQGRGIERQNIEKVFEPYYSTKPMGKDRGTGLGMSIAWSIIKNHQGTIRIDSTPGVGTRVDILLPVFQKESIEEKEMDKATAEAPTEKTDTLPLILFMDDDMMMRDISAKILSRLGYEPVLAENGEEALEAFKSWQTNGRTIQIAILDLEVRQGMGGPETNERLKALNPDLKSIIASGYASDPVMENYETEGFGAALAKPFSMEDLKQALAKVQSLEN